MIELAQEKPRFGYRWLLVLIRVLGVVGTFTRECLALEVDTSFASRRVTRVSDEVILQRERPRRLLMDNGSELTLRHFLSRCRTRTWKGSTGSCATNA